MPDLRYSRTALRVASDLADWIALTSSDTGRVDWERATKERLSRTEIRALESPFKVWLRLNFGIEGSLIHWAADPAVTSAGVQRSLRLFGKLGSISLDAAMILREAAKLINDEGWVQGQLRGPHAGYDTVGAVAEVCERNNVDVSLRVAIIQALLDRVLATTQGFVAVSDWNDHPSRTPRDVLRLLSICAGDMETI